MSVSLDRRVNEAFRVMRKRVRVFARRHVDNLDDIDDMTNDACEKAYRRFRALTQNIELNEGNFDEIMAKAYQRAATAIYGARIDQFRKREIRRRHLESLSPEIIAGTWLGGGYHAPSPDQRLIVRQTMAVVAAHSTTPSQRRLGAALQAHVDREELDVSPVDLAEEAGETANNRYAWARKLRTKVLA